jgi:predicted RNA-binding protein Jag
MNYKEFTGKTVEEAIALGLEELGLTQEQADIRVLEEGKKKLFGSIKARVEIAPLTEEPQTVVPVATGKTDGETVRALVKGEPSAVVALRVLTAQGILFRQTYGELREELLYDVPVVREDDEAFPALLQLRWGYCLYRGEEALAIRAAERIESLYDELPYTSRCDIACDLVYTRCVLKGDTEGVEAYVEDITDAYGQPSYFRAKAAYYRAIGDEVEYRQALEQALSAVENAPIYGLKTLEEKLLERIAQE